MSTRYHRITEIMYDGPSLWDGPVLDYLVPPDEYPLGVDGTHPAAIKIRVAKAVALFLKHGCGFNIGLGCMTLNQFKEENEPTEYHQSLIDEMKYLHDPPSRNEFDMREWCDFNSFAEEVENALHQEKYYIMYYVS